MKFFREILANRTLLVELVRRDIRGRFAGARFGLLWSLFNPAIQLLSYGLIFGFLYGASDPTRRSVLVASLFCGLFPWWAFQEGATRGMSAFVDQSALLRRIPMPPFLCVCAATISSFLLQMVGFLLFLAAFSLAGLVTPAIVWLWLPLVMLLSLALSLSLGMVLAPIYLAVRDTMWVVTALMTVGFFASPVLYELDFLPSSIRFLAAWNPMAALIGLYRSLVLGVAWPEPLAVLVLLGAIAALCALAVALMRRLEGRLDEYW